MRTHSYGSTVNYKGPLGTFIAMGNVGLIPKKGSTEMYVANFRAL